MSTVTSSIGSVSSASQERTAGTGSTSALGKDQFLKLLTAQLSNQDPLSPMDSQDFAAQLAQFSTVEQLENIGTRLDTLLVAQASANQMNATSLVGRSVRYAADHVALAADGAPAEFQVQLGADAVDVVAVVTDANGRVVRTLDLGAHAQGATTASWDGRDANGAAAPAGSYTVTISAEDADGAAVTAATTVRGTVSGVTFENGSAELLIGTSRVPLADVTEILSNA